MYPFDPPFGPPRGPVRPAPSGLPPDPLFASLQQARVDAFAAAGAAYAEEQRRTVAANRARHLEALRVAPPASTAWHPTARAVQAHRAALAVPVGSAGFAALGTQQRQLAAYVARRAPTHAAVRPSPSPVERLAQSTRLTNPAAVALAVEHDPALRATAAGGAAVVGGLVAGQAAAAAWAEEHAAWLTWRWIGWRAATLRFGANAAGQGIGNFATYGDAQKSVYRINWISSLLAGGGVPQMASSAGAAAFKFDFTQGYRSILTGEISGSAFALDFGLGYGLGQAARQSGFDNLHRSTEAQAFLNMLRHRMQVLLSPRFAQGVGEVLPQALEASNRTASTAARKVGAERIKQRLPK